MVVRIRCPVLIRVACVNPAGVLQQRVRRGRHPQRQQNRRHGCLEPSHVGRLQAPQDTFNHFVAQQGARDNYQKLRRHFPMRQRASRNLSIGLPREHQSQKDSGSSFGKLQRQSHQSVVLNCHALQCKRIFCLGRALAERLASNFKPSGPSFLLACHGPA